MAVAAITIQASSYGLPDPATIVASQDKEFFFRKREGVSELWAVDADDPQSRSIVPTYPNLNLSDVQNLAARDGVAFFLAGNGDFANGQVQVWRSDGTPEGTIQLSHGVGSGQEAIAIASGLVGTSNATPIEMMSAGVVFKRYNSATNASQLWVQPFDGGQEVELTQVFTGQGTLGTIHVAEDRIVFEQVTNHVDRQLWISDGTIAGTKPLAGDMPMPSASLLSAVKATPTGLISLVRDAVWLPYEAGRIDFSGNFKTLSRPNATVGDSEVFDVQTVVQSRSGNLLRVGPFGFWLDSRSVLSPIDDPVELSSTIVRLTDELGDAIWSIANADSGNNAASGNSGLAIQRTDPTTDLQSETSFPTATALTTLKVVGKHLVYESADATGRQLIAVDVNSGVVTTLETLAPSDVVTLESISADTLIARHEGQERAVVSRIQVSNTDDGSIESVVLVDQLSLSSSIKRMGDDLLTYVPTSSGQDLVRIDVKTGVQSTIFSTSLPSAGVEFVTDVRWASSNTASVGDHGIVYDVQTPSGINELWWASGVDRTMVARLVSGTTFQRIASLQNLLVPTQLPLTTVGGDTAYFVLEGTQPSIGRLTIDDAGHRFETFPTQGAVSIVASAQGVLFSDNDNLYAWDDDADLPTALPVERDSLTKVSTVPDRFAMPRLLSALPMGEFYSSDGTLEGSFLLDSQESLAARTGGVANAIELLFAVSGNAVYARTRYAGGLVWVERENAVGLQQFETPGAMAREIAVDRLAGGWIARATSSTGTSTLWWWGDDEATATQIVLPFDAIGDTGWQVAFATATHLLIYLTNAQGFPIDLWAVNHLEQRSLVAAINGQVNPQIISHVSQLDGDLIVAVSIANSLNPVTVRWDLVENSVRRLLAPSDEQFGQNVFRSGTGLALLRSTGRYDVADALTFPPIHNTLLSEDVNGDGMVSAVDVLLVINLLSRQRQDTEAVATHRNYGLRLPDVSADNLVSAIDALMIINHLARISGNQSAGESLVAFDWATATRHTLASVWDTDWLSPIDGLLF